MKTIFDKILKETKMEKQSELKPPTKKVFKKITKNQENHKAFQNENSFQIRINNVIILVLKFENISIPVISCIFSRNKILKFFPTPNSRLFFKQP